MSVTGSNLRNIEIEDGGMSPAVVELQVTIVETANRDNVIAVVEDYDCGGMIPYASTGIRVKNAYLRAGDNFADDLINETLYDD